MKCRHCAAELSHVFADLATSPLSNDYLSAQKLQAPETFFPLRVLVCEQCWLVQTEDYAAADALFTADYAYFSSVSTSWLRHAETYVAMMVERFDLGTDSFVVEIAANDGYLLQYVAARGIPCLGIEPTASTAAAARAKGIEVAEAFFGTALAQELATQGRRADLVTCNNVLAHVPDINDFVTGIACLLAPTGVATFEFPHLKNLVEQNQFDTIYHEHYSYLSLIAVQRILAAAGLTVFEVEELPTHGGSLRVYAQRQGAPHPISHCVAVLLAAECAAGMDRIGFYTAFQPRIESIKDDLLSFLIDAKRKGLRVVGYGAAAKGNTLLNFAGVRADLLAYVVDRNPHKVGKRLPGSRIPVVAEHHLQADRPDIVLILPWNLSDEIVAQLSYVREWQGRFVRAIPSLSVFA